MPAKSLVVYYSRTGTTAAVAQLIASGIGAELEKIEDKKDRRGLLGALRTGKDVFLNKLAEIEQPKNDPSNYDLVIIGTPVWAGGLSLPVKAYILKFKQKFRSIAFFCTSGGFSSKNVLKDMAYLCGREPVATLSVSHLSYFTGGYKKNVAKFIKSISEPSPK